MAADTELVLLFGGLHLVALLLGCGLFWMFLRSETVTPWEQGDDDENDGGGGGNDRLREPPKPPKPGGVPLPDAQQSSQRFRGPGRLADRHRTIRRPAHDPAPIRSPHRERTGTHLRPTRLRSGPSARPSGLRHPLGR